MHGLRKLSVPVLLVATGVTITQVTPAQAAAADVTGARIVARPDGYAIIAGDGQQNKLTLEASADALTIHDEGITEFAKYPDTCTATPVATGAAVTCPLTGDARARVQLRDGDDELFGATLPASVALRVETGTGNDVVLGGDGDDWILGGSLPGETDTLYGGYGDDRVRGGEGDDYVRGNDGNDIVKGGGGSVDFLIGDDGDDLMFGSDAVDYIHGNAGNDYLIGYGAFDNLTGGAGDDHLFGGTGGDLLRGGPGTDRYRAGAGDDEILARDDTPDDVGCGDGQDVAKVDAGIEIAVGKNCEDVRAN